MGYADTEEWLAVVDALGNDPDDDVTAGDDGLRVHGRLFAIPTAAGIVVDLLPTRAADLVNREIARKADIAEGAKGEWVVIDDSGDWVELAGEAHQYVGEPQVGGES
jgi:hypothetical protein